MEMDKFNELEKKIIYLFENKNKLIKKHVIFNALKNEYSEDEINSTLDNLEINGYLYLNASKEYQLMMYSPQTKLGEIKYNSKNKYFYVVCGKSVITIPSKYLNGAIIGDLVIVKPRNHNGETIMEVEKILKRKNNGLVFDYINGKFKPFDNDSKVKLYIPEEQMAKVVEGSRVLIKVSLEKTNNAYNGQIISFVGHKDDPHLDIKTIASKHGAIIDFSKEALEQANSIKNCVTQDDIDIRLSEGGIDLRNKTIFTIDGESTKDIDDAVSVEKLDNGNYLLGVHIADVSHYVTEDSVLDLEARERSTSIYPYNYVIPMLPHILSNGICSLNPNVDRLALSWLIEINPYGEIVDYDIKESIINSKKKMSYEKINDIFEKGIMHDDYEPFLKDLSMMIELSHILNQRKLDRGYLSFGDDDVKFVDDNGKPLEIKKRVRGTSEKMIEDFMLIANEISAKQTKYYNIPAIYRNHPAPNPLSIKNIIEMLNLNIKLTNNIDNPKKLQGIIKKIQNIDESGIFLEWLLRSMQRAYYSTNEEIGHFGLVLKDYAHSTSPIRRYPDLTTHRLLKLIIHTKNIEDVDSLYEKLILIAQKASFKEREADKIEMEANQYKMAEWMEDHIGDYFAAYVSNFSKNGLSIKTTNLISGKISMENLINAGFKYDNTRRLLFNEKTNETLDLGEKILVQVKGADKDIPKIDFEFIEKTPKEKNKTKIIEYRNAV